MKPNPPKVLRTTGDRYKHVKGAMGDRQRPLGGAREKILSLLGERGQMTNRELSDALDGYEPYHQLHRMLGEGVVCKIRQRDPKWGVMSDVWYLRGNDAAVQLPESL